MGRAVRRVPLDFDWPLRTVWTGFQMPAALRLPHCPDCEQPPLSEAEEPRSDGLSPRGREIDNTFHPDQIWWAPPHVAEQLAWHDKLTQDEVDYLVALGRLVEFGPFHDRHELPEPGPDGTRYVYTRNQRPAPRAAEVNAAQRDHLVHDAVNRSYLLEARWRRLGIDQPYCRRCAGRGHLGSPEQVAAEEAWQPVDPPPGEGWQLWETTTEGSPISPVFATGEDLVAWMSHPDRGGAWLPAAAAAAFIAEGAAPTVIAGPYGAATGAEVTGLHTDGPQN